MTSRVLYLPIEIVERELDAKLLLALEALDRDYVVFFGHYWTLPEIAKRLRGGFYLYKAMTDYRAKKLFGPLAEHKVLSGVLDEEGLIFPSLDYYVRTRIGAGKSLPLLSKIFTWGEEQAQHIAKTFEITFDKDKLVTTGNPRFDLLRPPYNHIYAQRADEIAKTYGDFVLVNTNFGPGNYSPKFGMSYHEHMRHFGRISTPEEENYYSERTKYYENLFFHYVEMVKALAKEIFPIRVIVRPHPVEDHQRWRSLIADSANVHVLFQGSAIDWIGASKCMIHTGCTTGIEAFVLGKAIYRYNPNLRLDMESELPNRLGAECVEVNDLINQVSAYLKGSDMPPAHQQSEYLMRWVQNLQGSYSYERIMNAIDQVPLESISIHPKTIRMERKYVRTILRNEIIRFLGTLSKSWKPLSHLKLFKKAAEAVQRFPGIRGSMVNDRLTTLYQLKHGTPPRGFNINAVGPDIYRIEIKK